MRRSRGGAIEQNEQKPKNGSRAAPSGPVYIMTSGSVDICIYHDLLKVTTGQTWVKSPNFD